MSSGESGATIEQVSAAVTAKRSTWRSGISRAMTSTWVPVTVPACQASSTSGQAPSRVARLASRRASAVEARPRWRRKAAIEPKPSTSYGRRPGVGGLGLGEAGIERVAEAAELDDGGGVGRHLRRLDGLPERFEHEMQPTKHQYD